MLGIHRWLRVGLLIMLSTGLGACSGVILSHPSRWIWRSRSLWISRAKG